MQGNPEALKKAAALLVEAKAPLIIADCVGRHPEAVSSLIDIAELLSIPVIDKGSRFNFPNTHPLDVTEGAGELMRKADVLLALDVQDLFGGLSALNRQTRETEYILSPSAKIIHVSMNDMLIHSWASDYQRLEAVDVPISGDTSVVLPELTRLCRQVIGNAEKSKDVRTARFNDVKENHERLRRGWSDEAHATASRKEIATAFLALEIWEVIKNEDWVLANGSSNGWARRLWDWTRPYQFLGRNGGAGIGYGMGASIGAALAHGGTGRVCVDIQGDGDLLMTPSALWTAAHHKIPLLMVIFNNQSFYNSEDHQVRTATFRNRPVETAGIGSHLDNPAINFAKMAESYGIYSEGPIQRSGDLRPALQRALKIVKEKHLPALVDVITEAR